MDKIFDRGQMNITRPIQVPLYIMMVKVFINMIGKRDPAMPVRVPFWTRMFKVFNIEMDKIFNIEMINIFIVFMIPLPL